MRTIRYLNTILMIIAVLLTLNLWVLWTSTPGGQSASFASEADAATARRGQGMPNAAQQRKNTIDQLKKLNAQMSDLKTLFSSGKARVRIEGGSQPK